jgi:hypothetical protein
VGYYCFWPITSDPKLVKRNLLILHWLNFDTALGAAITSLFIAKEIGSIVPNVAIMALMLSVLAIYNFDHLIDVRKIEGIAISQRHRFYQKHFRVLSIYQILLLLALPLFVWLMPVAITKAGIVLAIIALIYFLLLFVILPNRFILKELFISIVFVCGVFLAPLAADHFSTITLETIFLAIQIFLLAMANILVFSWFDYDLDNKESHASLTRILGKKNTFALSLVLFSFLGSTIVLNLVFIPDVLSQVIITTMGLVLLVTLVLNRRIADNEVYRIIGEAIFLIPIFALL